MKKNPTKVVTGINTRWSYCNAWTPKSIEGSDLKYSVSLSIPKSDTATVEKIKSAISAAYSEGESKLKGNSKVAPPLSAIKNPLRDGDVERLDDAAYHNAYFVNANSSTAPGIVDANRQPIIEHSEVYSGVYGRASINFYAFNRNGNRGIACGLNNLQKIRDGEIIASGKRGRNGYAISYQEVEKYSAKTKKSGIIISDKSQVSNILPSTSEINNPQKLAEFIDGMEDEVTLKEMQLERLQLDRDDSVEYKKQELDAKIEIQELKNQIKGLKFKLKSLSQLNSE